MQYPALKFSLLQLDDGDGLLRFKVEASNSIFSGGSDFWVYAASFTELATLLKGFPLSIASKVTYKVSSECSLSFYCINGLGHIVVWVSIRSEHDVPQTTKYQTTELCLKIEASAIDKFHNELSGIASGALTEATLYGS